MLIVTRSLNPQEFGTWTLLYGLILYVTLIQPITSYWVTREVARGEKSAKTAILSSGMFSLTTPLKPNKEIPLPLEFTKSIFLSKSLNRE